MIIALGAFDGFHRGHQRLLAHCRTLSEKRGEGWGVLRLHPHPALIASSDFSQLFTEDEKSFTLAMSNVASCPLPFDHHLQASEPEVFLEALAHRYQATSFVVGDDFRFGHGRKGDVAFLRGWTAERGGVTLQVPSVIEEGARVSSTLLRHLLAHGRVEDMRTFLGYPWFIRSLVKHGHGRGGSLGFPTVNLDIPENKAMPAYGVYASQTLVGNSWWPSATSWGINYTFDDERPAFETTLLGYEGELYGQTLCVALTHYLRPMMWLPTLQALKDRIAFDCETSQLFAARCCLNGRRLLNF